MNHTIGYTGYTLRKSVPDFYLHEYSSYEEYKDTQIFHNKRKIHQVWADPRTLDIIIGRVRKEFPEATQLFALCHGTRNGFEQNYIASKLNVDITGTDISETASQYPRSMQWDFHDTNVEWTGKCDFIYTNSLDQSWKPQQAVSTWVDQLRPGGILFIEHTMVHSAEGANKMDPFGATPFLMPYLLAEWLGHRISTDITKSVKPNLELEVWLFAVRRVR